MFAIKMWDSVKQVMIKVMIHSSDIISSVLVSADRVNWFLYDFEVELELLRDEKFLQTFKK